VSLPRDRFWDLPVAKIDSLTRQPMCPGRPAYATLGTKRLAQLPQWLYGARMCLSHIPSGCCENTWRLPRTIRLGLRPSMADSAWPRCDRFLPVSARTPTRHSTGSHPRGGSPVKARCRCQTYRRASASVQSAVNRKSDKPIWKVTAGNCIAVDLSSCRWLLNCEFETYRVPPLPRRRRGPSQPEYRCHLWWHHAAKATGTAITSSGFRRARNVTTCKPRLFEAILRKFHSSLREPQFIRKNGHYYKGSGLFHCPSQLCTHDRHNPSSLSQISIRSATTCHPASNIMSCAIPGNTSACVW